jgi:FKBP-type peptidyl-prolyl cis-trans isomerase
VVLVVPVISGDLEFMESDNILLIIYMKKIALLYSLFLLSISLFAQQPSQKYAGQSQSPVKLLTTIDTVQYSLGAYIGQWFQKNGFSVTNMSLFQRGMDDVLQNKNLAVSDSIIAPIVASYQISLQNTRSRALEDQLFANLKGKPGVGALPNGVHYIVVKSGTGIRPELKDTVVFNTIGVFPDGTLFEDTYQKKQVITTIVSDLIPGLAEAIQLMPEGSTWRIFVPSVLAYGSAGRTGIIPPNMALVFDISLVKVRQVNN